MFDYSEYTDEELAASLEAEHDQLAIHLESAKVCRGKVRAGCLVDANASLHLIRAMHAEIVKRCR